MKKILLVILLLLFVTPVHASDLKGLLVIPSINVREEIGFAPLENRTWDAKYWAGRVAHLGGTGWVDDPQYTVVLVSHDGGPLHDIPLLKNGDFIYIYDGKWEAVYQVSSSWITHWTDTSPIMPTTTPTLTMIICWGVEDRYIVRADRISLRDQFTGEQK